MCSTPQENMSSGEKPCAQSMFNQTLGFIDDICQIPKPQEPGPTVAAESPSRIEWGAVPSQDESTFPSLQSTTEGQSNAEYSKSFMTSTEGDRKSDGNMNDSEDHENFEVVLDSTLLQGNASPKRDTWFCSRSSDGQESVSVEEDVPVEPEKPQETVPKRSLMKRLFSRKKKEKAAPKELVVEEPEAQPEETKEEEQQEEEEPVIKIPEMAQRPPEPLSGRKTQFENRPRIGHVRSAPPSTSAPRATSSVRREKVPRENNMSPAEEILSTLGSILSSLGPTGSIEEEEKKEEDFMPQEAPHFIKTFDDDQGPEDETDNNIDSVPAMVEPEVLNSMEKRKKGPKIPISLGVLAKKISKPFMKKMDSNSKISEEENQARDQTSSAPIDARAGEVPVSSKKKKSKKNKPLWKSAVDPSTGRTYWYNRITRISTYDPPPEALAQAVESKGDSSPTVARKKATKKKKPMWKAVVDKNSGRTYYYHRKTRETTWVMPEELKLLEEREAQEADAAPLQTNDITGNDGVEHIKEPEVADKVDEVTEEVTPPMVVEAAMTEESQARINKGEQGLLGTSFGDVGDKGTELQTKFDPVNDKKKEIMRLLDSLKPPDKSSVDELMKEYEGREDILLRQLREKVESRPFDEPVVDLESVPNAPLPRMNGRSTTFLSKASATTKSSTITDKTERIRNTLGKSRIDPISETLSTATSISSHRGDVLLNPVDTPPRSNTGAQYVHRERELKVEDLTNARVAAETFDKPGRFVRSRAHDPDELDDGSYYGDNEVDTYGTDSVSALSENDADFSHRKENFEQARRRALDDAIEREDWDLAAALSEGMRATNTVGDYARAHSSWNQSDLDKFIANNDWDAVKSYIARMRNAKKEGHAVVPLPVPTMTARNVASESVVRTPPPASLRNPPPPPFPQNHSFSKAVGAKSQLQHKAFMSDSSWTSDSYDSEEEEEESFDSDYS